MSGNQSNIKLLTAILVVRFHFFFTPAAVKRLSFNEKSQKWHQIGTSKDFVSSAGTVWFFPIYIFCPTEIYLPILCPVNIVF